MVVEEEESREEGEGLEEQDEEDSVVVVPPLYRCNLLGMAVVDCNLRNLKIKNEEYRNSNLHHCPHHDCLAQKVCHSSLSFESFRKGIKYHQSC